MPPCTSLVDLLLVPLAKSAFSTSATLYPRAAASSATPAPVTPPPITSTSNVSLPIAARLEARVENESSCILLHPFQRALHGPLPIFIQLVTLIRAHLRLKCAVNGPQFRDFPRAAPEVH